MRNDFALVPLLKGDRRRAELAEFEKREKITVGLNRTDCVTKYEADHQAKVQEVKRDFLNGDKADRVRVISKDDCR